jgi:hypothetical protein
MFTVELLTPDIIKLILELTHKMGTVFGRGTTPRTEVSALDKSMNGYHTLVPMYLKWRTQDYLGEIHF